jgi:hypothetical protein
MNQPGEIKDLIPPASQDNVCIRSGQGNRPLASCTGNLREPDAPSPSLHCGYSANAQYS